MTSFGILEVFLLKHLHFLLHNLLFPLLKCPINILNLCMLVGYFIWEHYLIKL